MSTRQRPQHGADPGTSELVVGRAPAPGWRLAGAGVIAVLVAVVALGLPPPDPSALRRPDGALPTAVTAGGTPALPPPSGPTVTTPAGVPEPAQVTELRYQDGIPARLGERPVLRLPFVLDPAGGPPDGWFLLGGWIGAPACQPPWGRRPTCEWGSHLAFADTPGGPARTDAEVVTEHPRPVPAGPIVVRARLVSRAATANERCLRFAGCVTRIAASDAVWQGDGWTDTRPLSVLPVVAALRGLEPTLSVEPLRERVGCDVPWPPQVYRAIGQRALHVVAVFPTTRARLVAEGDIRIAGAPREPGQPACVAAFARRLRDPAWVARANVMVLVDGRGGPARHALADALRATLEAGSGPG